MIGAGGLLGFRLPENFNRPYLARNVLDFWDRWHISVTHWIRDYVFMTSYKLAASRFPKVARYWSYLPCCSWRCCWPASGTGRPKATCLFGLPAMVWERRRLGLMGDILASAAGGRGAEGLFAESDSFSLDRNAGAHCTTSGSASCSFSHPAPGANFVGECCGAKYLTLQPMSRTAAGRLLGCSCSASLVGAVALWNADAIGSVLKTLAARTRQRPRVMYSILCTLTVVVGPRPLLRLGPFNKTQRTARALHRGSDLSRVGTGESRALRDPGLLSAAGAA